MSTPWSAAITGSCTWALRPALRERLGATEDWLDLAPAATANERLLALFGRLYVQGLRFDARPLAAAGARRVPLPTYPFENRPYRCKPVARRFDTAAAAPNRPRPRLRRLAACARSRTAR